MGVSEFEEFGHCSPPKVVRKPGIEQTRSAGGEYEGLEEGDSKVKLEGEGAGAGTPSSAKSFCSDSIPLLPLEFSQYFFFINNE